MVIDKIMLTMHIDDIEFVDYKQFIEVYIGTE